MVNRSISNLYPHKVCTDLNPFHVLGAVPVFQPTPSPDLDSLLADFRNNIFVPAHMIHSQKELTYRRSNWHLLSNPDEPATVRMGNEVFQLHRLDRTKDEPPTRKSFYRILKLMGECRDWKNLPGFLEGLKTAKRTIHVSMLQKLVRNANEAGQMGIILDCVRRVDGTGLSLSNLNVSSEVMLGATARAIQGKWSEAAVVKAVKYAENIWDEIWDPRHTKIGNDNPRIQPEIIGILLQMHAAKVAFFGAGEDDVNLVQKYLALMLKNWEHANLHVEEGDWHGANHIMVIWSPVWHGMKLARKIVGGETSLAKILDEKLEQELEPRLQTCQRSLEKASSDRRRGQILFDELSNTMPSEVGENP